MKTRLTIRTRNTLGVGGAAVIVALTSFIGAAAAAGKPIGAPPTTPVAEVAPTPANQESLIQPTVEQARERFIQSQMDLWDDLFAKQVGENPPMLMLDFRTDAPGLIPGVSEEGDPFTLIALEVTPIPVDDGSLTPVVSAEEIQRFKDAQGDASVVFGAIQTERGTRFVLGASGSFRNEVGGIETVFVPLAVSARGDTCPTPSPIQANTLVPAAGDERAWGYCRCVAQILKAELWTGLCIAAAPAAAYYTCGPVCVGTAGVACVRCIALAAGAILTACEKAYEAWSVAAANGCIPYFEP